MFQIPNWGQWRSGFWGPKPVQQPVVDGPSGIPDTVPTQCGPVTRCISFVYLFICHTSGWPVPHWLTGQETQPTNRPQSLHFIHQLKATQISGVPMYPWSGLGQRSMSLDVLQRESAECLGSYLLFSVVAKLRRHRKSVKAQRVRLYCSPIGCVAFLQLAANKAPTDTSNFSVV